MAHRNRFLSLVHPGACVKGIIISVGIVIALLLLLTLFKRDELQPADGDSYALLRQQCDGDGCCLESVDRMEEGGFAFSEDGSCPEGYSPNMLRCVNSYSWCEPDII